MKNSDIINNYVNEIHYKTLDIINICHNFNIDNLHLIKEPDLFQKDIIIKMIYKLANYKGKQKIKVKYPKDWWQAFKERWFPKWLLKKYPVKYYNKIYSINNYYHVYRDIEGIKELNYAFSEFKPKEGE